MPSIKGSITISIGWPWPDTCLNRSSAALRTAASTGSGIGGVTVGAGKPAGGAAIFGAPTCAAAWAVSNATMKRPRTNLMADSFHVALR